MVNITRALATDGFMDSLELMWLAEEASHRQRIVEVGSYLGRSTRAMADNTQGVVYAIDDWIGPRDWYLEKEERRALLQLFFNNVSDLLGEGKVKAIQTDHDSCPSDLYPDMVFIDGDHGYGSVVRDITFWRNQLPNGGLLCGHDAYDAQVTKALMDTIGNVEVIDNTSIWRMNV